MRTSRLVPGALALLLAAGMAAGCGSGTKTPNTQDDSISLNSTEPENSLIPGNTTDAGGSKILRTLFKGLVDYDPKTAAPRNAVAESIDTTDSRVFTITVRHGWTFHDGTPVTAHSFVDAWNYTAYQPDHQQGAGFLSVIDGFDKVDPPAPAGADQTAPAPAAKELSGLHVIDDYKFTVTLTQPMPSFPTRLGYVAYYPLPQSFFTDRAGFEAHPIGDGPFRFVSHTKGSDLVVERYDRYAGPHKPSIRRAQFRFDPSLEHAYADVVANKLDFLEVLPGEALVDGRYKRDLAGRNFTRADTGLQSLTFPLYDPRFADPRVRQAISMAVDRQGVIDKVFTGDRTPAGGLVPPTARGAIATGQCGELCQYRPQQAKALFDSTGFQGPIEIASNTDTANEKWLTAVCASITAALGRECTFHGVPTLGEIRRQINAHQMSAIYRTGWVADYPSIENFLNPLYRTGGSSNTGLYSNPQVDALLARADAARTDQESWPLYQQAEKLVLQDMPAVPLLVPGVQTGWSQRLRTVTVTPFRDLDLESVTVAPATDRAAG
ncbi:ABC transporter substrate-binding protein [Nocardia terpenica]|uniref:peptide ABC transporter substrate-binding protein n=1 Tax=Nocardia terpenica TaxID=455432 RepID=UPI002FE03C19